ncbi:MAG: translation initiation factor IF-2 [Clostridiales bacterium]|nr:translation initiation factor IF-2 [Clostridiales bacterium]
MSKATDIHSTGKELLEKIKNAKEILSAQKKALTDKEAELRKKAEDERIKKEKAEQEEAMRAYQKQRVKEEAEELQKEQEEAARIKKEEEAKTKKEAAPKKEEKQEFKKSPENKGFKKPDQQGYQNAQYDRRKEQRNDKPFNKNRDNFNKNDDKGDNRGTDRKPQQKPRMAPAPVLPTAEKERVSNYDPNKKNYRKNHDNEQQPKQNKKENSRRQQNFNADDEDYFRVRKPKKEKKEPKREIAPIVIENAVMTTENIGIKDLSEKLGKPAADIVKKLFMMGIMATVNQEIDYETAFLVASEYGIELEQKLTKTFEDTLIDVSDEGDKDGEGYVTRPPVVTIMGHVDHGKTSLLDAIRHANVTAGEAGGITQHIGAYQVEANGKKITFIDTPGHEAFTSMRARGAQSTDIAILVVAADDGVMPQTIESISHAKAAGVPMIVAINKMDKPTADPDRVKTELTQHGIVPEDWGGDTIIVPVSAYTKDGIDDLLENILLVAEVEDYKANPDLMARGIIIEARLDKGRGPVASVLVQNGTLKVGDTIVAGTVFGRVRAMMNDKGEKLNVAPPSTPVEVLGLNEVPETGDQLFATEDDRLSRQVAQERRDKIKIQQAKAKAKASLDDLFAQIQEGELKQLNLIIKADVQGSVEAVKQALEKLTNEEVKVSAIHGAVGAITSSDVALAQASNAIIIGFNVRPDSTARTMAEQEKVDIRLYRIIYDAIEDVEKAMKGMLAPEFKEVILGHAEVRQTFKVPGHGTVAGSYVTDGKITRQSKLRLLRDNIVIHEGEVESLRRFKDDVKEVATGYECGIGIVGYNDIKEKDVIEAFIMEEIAR